MITGSLWPAALTAVFVAAALSYAIQARGTAGWLRKGVWLLHALAAVAMAAMLWPIGMAVSPLLYLLFFTACGLFVVFVGVFFGSLAHWPYHTAMMVAMAPMPVLMTAPSAAAATPVMSQHAQHMARATEPVLGTAIPMWLRASSAALAALLFFVSALWWFYVVFRGPRRPFADLLMAIGMGSYFALCI